MFWDEIFCSLQLHTQLKENMKTTCQSPTTQFQLINFDGWRYHFEVCLDFQGYLSCSTAKDLSRIVKKVFPSTANAFRQHESELFYEDVYDHVKTSHSLLICYLESNVVGFASFKDFMELDTLFVNGIAIHSAHQGCGIARKSVDMLIKHVPRKRLAFTTQNPCMYQLVRSKSKIIFPHYSGINIPDIEHEYCSQLMSGRQGEYDPRTSIAKGLYGSCMYPHLPRCHDQTINNWFDHALSVKDGQTCDGMLVIGVLK